MRLESITGVYARGLLKLAVAGVAAAAISLGNGAGERRDVFAGALTGVLLGLLRVADLRSLGKCRASPPPEGTQILRPRWLTPFDGGVAALLMFFGVRDAGSLTFVAAAIAAALPPATAVCAVLRRWESQRNVLYLQERGVLRWSGPRRWAVPAAPR